MAKTIFVTKEQVKFRGLVKDFCWYQLSELSHSTFNEIWASNCRKSMTERNLKTLDQKLIKEYLSKVDVYGFDTQF